MRFLKAAIGIFTAVSVQIVLGFILAAILLSACARVHGGEPKFTPQAKYHEAAVSVRVEVGGGYQYGSGIYIQSGNLRGILTVSHLFQCKDNSCPVAGTVVRWKDGSTSPTRVYTTDKNGHDLAFIFATSEKFLPVPVATKSPVKSQVVEFLTYGEPEKISTNKFKLRHFPGRVIYSTVNAFHCNTPVIQGDSGGGILSWPGHELLGIQSAGIPEPNGSPFARYGNRSIFRQSRVVGVSPIRAFLKRVEDRAAKGGFPNTQYRCYPCEQQQYQPQIPRQAGLFNKQEIYVQPQTPPQLNQGDLWPDDNFEEVYQPQSPAPEPAPVQPAPTPVVNKDCVERAELEALIGQLQAEIDQLKNQPAPTMPKPEVDAEDIKALESQLETLRFSLESLSNRPIVVEMLNEQGEVTQRKSYLPGKPIRLQGSYSPAK